jgi:Uma2 family endonuclease
MSGAAAKRAPYTRADFLAWERQQTDRYEFLDGVITMMAGGTWDHGTIGGNIFAFLHSALDGTRCYPQQQTQRLAPRHREDMTYPDVLVVCTEIEDKATEVDHATVLVEVVSENSRVRDFLKKWDLYRGVPELRHYLLLEQDRPVATLFSRGSEDEPWVETRIEGLEEAVELAAIGVTLPMVRIFVGTQVGKASER